MRRLAFKYLPPFGGGLIWVLGWVVATVLFSVLAMRLTDDIQVWSDWLREHALALLFWRLCLYAAMIFGWYWMRARLPVREPQAALRLRRVECAGVAALVLLEVVNAVSGQEAQ